MSRPVLLALGLAALALAWAPWTGAALGHGFTSHMARHMAVVAVAAPLIALGVAGGRFDPSKNRSLLFAAIPASLVELFVVWGWHAPAAHDLARADMAAYAAEQASFLLAGLWVWIACFGHAAADRPRRAAEGAIAMLLTSIHMTLLGALLSLSVRPLYAGHHAGHGQMALDDQHLGGIVMLLAGGAVYLAGGVTLVARLLRQDQGSEPADRLPPFPLRGGVGGGGGAERGAGGEQARRSTASPHPAPPPPLPSPQGGGSGRVARSVGSQISSTGAAR